MSDRGPSHRIDELPVLVLMPHNRCNCRCVMCDIWKIRQVREITEQDLEPHVASLRALKVKWIVFSGGEPLMHSDLPSLCRLCRCEGIRLTLLTAGLSLERHAVDVVGLMDDVIVSLDGPPGVHDEIRGVRGAYRQLQRGIEAVRMLRPEIPVHARCTVQKSNFGYLSETVGAARDLKLNSLSFLAADLTSAAFNRSDRWSAERQAETALSIAEASAFDAAIEALIAECRSEIESGFIVEKPDKLRRLGFHFRAHLDPQIAVAPRCNAPWVSAVIESDGSVRPCFFHASIGNIHDLPLAEVLNSAAALSFRERLDVASDPTCRNCVCSLFIERPVPVAVS